ncbi:MAG: YkgJ family cysteine cluster protein [Bacteroidales bacterium]
MNDAIKLKQLAAQAEPKFRAFFKQNKRRIEKMDTLVQELHLSEEEQINCMDCAACCKLLGPAIYDKDIERMAKALRLTPSQVVGKYLHIDEDSDYVFTIMPCPFLLADNACSIYEHRPKACREYPHTDRKKFAQIYLRTVKNAYICPIAYNVLTNLMKQ